MIQPLLPTITLRPIRPPRDAHMPARADIRTRRECPEHRLVLLLSENTSRGAGLWCPRGHAPERWLVVELTEDNRRAVVCLAESEEDSPILHSMPA